MRLKNVKNASEIIMNSSYLIKDPKLYKGKYNKLFGNDNPIDIEIGMGKGDFIIGMAMQNPNVNYIGIEMYDSVIVRAVQKLENKIIPNLRLIRMDANLIDEVFEKEINTIYLNFSDPWPKKRHEKRRLTSHEFLKKYDNLFKGEKKIFQKTDNLGLFAFSIESLSTYGYTLKNVTLDLYNNMIENNVQTEYEKKFESKNVKICRLEAYKND
ncbi:MAG TPA: tRNA (guanosine(46)-N7)-methyltransferase TrmB [Candidatus Aphodocola excrementigallinarum]|uniref:tRNA (guanine-N(7)-)-methyltransferase n=1 Tax=Candidatus Aphodocola excrementigallinarum TaxID=2840670 RepID=A0A9D1IM85_9FIRM|nr:tRNA (guanosine(46)-N7)-methyltransferase TrmB [Candidatus Aphodocola excrementigallinarum]